MTSEQNNYKSVFEDWDRRVTRAVEAHYESSKRLQKHHYIIGIVALVIVTLLGASKNMKIEGEYSWLCSLLFYIISIAAALLVGLQTFLKYGERSEKHKEVASSYGALRRQIEHLAKKSFENKETLEVCIDNLRKEWDSLSKSSPAANSKVWTDVRKKYDSKIFKSRLYDK